MKEGRGRQRKTRERSQTLLISRSEDYDARMVPNETLSDANLTGVGRVWTRPLDYHFGVHNLHHQVMAR